MPEILQYGHSDSPRRLPWRRILIIAIIVVATPFLLLGAFAAWFEYEMTRNEVVITVDNRSNAAVHAALFNEGGSSPIVAAPVVGANANSHASRNTWRTISSAQFRVRVGTTIYEGDAGTLLDDDGPHRFWVVVNPDSVKVTRQSNEDPWQLLLSPVPSTKPSQ